MQQVLIYADSLTSGIIPNTKKLLECDSGWLGILDDRLLVNNLRVRVTEACLSGRRAVWLDPFKVGHSEQKDDRTN